MDGRKISIVYPNVNQYTQWVELKYSLRSLEKYLIGVDYDVIIVGDFPDKLDLDKKKITFIECKCSGQTSRLDQAVKRVAVDNDLRVNEEYFWMNDDIYFIRPVTYPDLCIPRALYDLKNHITKFTAGAGAHRSVWARDSINTFDRLIAEKLPTNYYSLHLPYRYEKTKSKELFKRFDLLKNPYVFENLYFNLFHADITRMLPEYIFPVISVIKSEFDEKKLQENMENSNKLFLNNAEEGMTPKFKEILFSMFNKKSRFEL